MEIKPLAMSESLTDRTEPWSWRGAGEAGFGAESHLDRHKALSCIGLSVPKRAIRCISGDWIWQNK